MTTIGTIPVEHESVAVLYEPHTGQVLHRHHVVTFRGGQHPDESTIERDAREQLAHARPTLAHPVAVLHVDPRLVGSTAIHRVDTKRGVLVEVASPPPRRRA